MKKEKDKAQGHTYYTGNKPFKSKIKVKEDNVLEMGTTCNLNITIKWGMQYVT